MSELLGREAETEQLKDKLASLETALRMREEGVDKSLDEYKGILGEIQGKKDELQAKDGELAKRADEFERSIEEFELLQGEQEKERRLLGEKETGLEQLRTELEKWRQELLHRREQIEEEVRERVVVLQNDMKPAPPVGEQKGVTDDALTRRELELRHLEEQIHLRERDAETRERTVAVEIERLEKERVEIQDLWEKVDGSKKGLTNMVDGKTLEELARRTQETDDLFLKLTEREETIRKDEQRLEGEWERLHVIEEELSDLAKLLKNKEDELRRTDGAV